MRVRWNERTLLHSYIYAVTALLVLYIVPVILFEFLGMSVDGVPGTLRDLAGALHHYFFLIEVPVVSLLLGAPSMCLLGRRSVPDDPKELPRHIGYLMTFVTWLSIIIWIIDMPVY